MTRSMKIRIALGLLGASVAGFGYWLGGGEFVRSPELAGAFVITVVFFLLGFIYPIFDDDGLFDNFQRDE